MSRIFTLLLLTVSTLLSAQAPKLEWAGAFVNKLMTSDPTPTSMTVDDSGNVYLFGQFQDSTDFDPGPGTLILGPGPGYDIFLCKLDRHGALLWAKKIGGTLSTTAGKMVMDKTGNLYFYGGFRGTIDLDPGIGTTLFTSPAGSAFICKLNAQGDLVWAKAGGSHSDITVTGGSLYFTGQFRDSIDFDPGNSNARLSTNSFGTDVYVLKLDTSGAFIWAKGMGGLSTDLAYGITADAEGNVYTTGTFHGTSDFDPGTGIANLYSPADYSLFVSRLDSNGQYVWAKAVTSTNGACLGKDISLDADGNVLLTGNFWGTTDFDPGTGVFNLTSGSPNTQDAFVCKLDSTGAFSWANSIGGDEDDFGVAIAVDDSGHVYTTGTFRGTVDFDPGLSTTLLTAGTIYDTYIRKLLPDGSFAWARAIEGAGNSIQKPISIATDHEDQIYVAGQFYDTTGIDLDPGPGVVSLHAPNGGSFIIKWKDTAVAPLLSARQPAVGNGITIAPQPATGNVVIHCTNAVLYEREARVYNMQGALIHRFRLERSTVLDVSSWVPGVYTLQLPNGEGMRLLRR